VDEVWPGAIPEVDDDLSEILTNVRVNRLPATRKQWANSWQTRAFLHLGLRLLYEHHSQEGESVSQGEGLHLWGTLTPENLANLAQRTITDPARADALSVVRWKETWGHRGAYSEDLIAYLFRPAPYLRRLEDLRPAMVIDPNQSVADFVRAVADAEFSTTLSDPLISMHTWLQAAMPTHPLIRQHVLRLEQTMLHIWSNVYEQSFPMFGLTPRPGVTWDDVAQLFSTLTEGVLLRSRTHGSHPLLSNGDTLLSRGALAIICGVFDVSMEELERRPSAHDDG
jgi:hypothetical protein